MALCASQGILKTDSLGNTVVDEKGTLQFRAIDRGRHVVVPERNNGSLRAFDADSGRAKGAGACWSNLAARGESHDIALYVGVSDTGKQQIEFLIHEKTKPQGTGVVCTGLSTASTGKAPGVPDAYYSIVNALSR